MVKAFSTISNQGGVGKSFVTGRLADFLSAATKRKHRVLVNDFDSLGTVTAMLIGRDRQDEFCEENLATRLILDRLDPENARFGFDAAVQRSVSNLRTADIDLLPSGSMTEHPDIPPDVEYSAELLLRAVGPNLSDYDVILVDCPRSAQSIETPCTVGPPMLLVPKYPSQLSQYPPFQGH